MTKVHPNFLPWNQKFNLHYSFTTIKINKISSIELLDALQNNLHLHKNRKYFINHWWTWTVKQLHISVQQGQPSNCPLIDHEYIESGFSYKLSLTLTYVGTISLLLGRSYLALTSQCRWSVWITVSQSISMQRFSTRVHYYLLRGSHV